MLPIGSIVRTVRGTADAAGRVAADTAHALIAAEQDRQHYQRKQTGRSPSATSLTFSTPRGSRPKLIGPGKVPNYGTIMPALSVSDQAEFDARRRDLTRAEEKAQREYNLGVIDHRNEFNREFKAARADRDRGELSLNGALADSGFADSPATAARGLYNLANELTASKQQLTLNQAEQDAALRRLYNEAHQARITGIADIERDRARRRNYNSAIQRVGAY